MATAPFSIATTVPGDTDVMSAYPAIERTFRDVVSSWLVLHSDATTGLLKASAMPTPLMVSTDGSAAAGPTLELFRDSPTPATNDVLGLYNLTGRDSAANKETYAQFGVIITDPTNTSEDGTFFINVITAGALTQSLLVTGTGVSVPGTLNVIGSVTGSNLLTVTNSISSTSGNVQAAQNFIGNNGPVVLATNGANNAFIRPNGAASSTGQLQVAASGAVTINGTLTVTG
jgi:hypothetical protein